ncbi:MAG: hypothetical protein MGG37_10880 [Trichodesmium sp. MAG_R01]|nr:hypothetical protein [Trichodesmium sp. MAG_R01]
MVEPVSTFLIGKWILTHIGIHGASAAAATAVGTGAVVAGALAVTYISYLTYKKIISWFQQSDVGGEATKDGNIAASFKEKNDSGQKVIVQGVFKKQTGDIIKGRVIEYEKLDSQTKELHRDGKLVIYE